MRQRKIETAAETYTAQLYDCLIPVIAIGASCIDMDGGQIWLQLKLNAKSTPDMSANQKEGA